MTKSNRQKYSAHKANASDQMSFFFSVLERALFYKSCYLTGTESGQYSLIRPPQGAVSDSLRVGSLSAPSSIY